MKEFISTYPALAWSIVSVMLALPQVLIAVGVVAACSLQGCLGGMPKVAAIQRNQLVYEGIAFEQRHPSRCNKPGKLAVGEAFFQRRDGGQGMDDVAHSA